MSNNLVGDFFCGVVEGFYGRPWNARQRHQLFEWMAQGGLNTYLYAPKDDLKHRTRWGELYDDLEAAEIGAAIHDCQLHGVHFIYSLAPGLSLRFSSAEHRRRLRAKLGQLGDLGVRHFALLFDDIPLQLTNEDEGSFQCPAAAQASVANEIAEDLSECGLMLCPTVYCGQMARPNVAEDTYLSELGKRLRPEIDVLWTGPEIVSEEIPDESIRDLEATLKRRPVIWDNLYANDYDPGRLYLGPYLGRSVALRRRLRGLLCNFNCQFEVNFVPLRTFADFCRADDETPWNPLASQRRALGDWLPAFAEAGAPTISKADFEWLSDVFYLPHCLGPKAATLLKHLRAILNGPREVWGKSMINVREDFRNLLSLQEKLVRIDNRELVFALYPFLWKLKEEILLVNSYVEWLAGTSGASGTFVSQEFRPGTYRGGFVATLQRMLEMDGTGHFQHRVAHDD